MHKNYYAIIPANVRYDKELPANAKLLYGEITALSNEKGYCWANNAYFAELYGIHERSISRLISQLEKRKYIAVVINKDEKNQVIDRHIYIGPVHNNVNTPIHKNVNTPIHKNVKYNNTSFFNNTESVVAPPQKSDKIQFAEFVFMTQDQYDVLVLGYGESVVKDYIDRLDEWQTNQKPSKRKVDHYKTLNNWLKRDTANQQIKQPTHERKTMKGIDEL